MIVTITLALISCCTYQSSGYNVCPIGQCDDSLCLAQSQQVNNERDGENYSTSMQLW